MSNDIDSDIDRGEPMAYQIRIRGHLGRQWMEWFGGLAITLEDSGDTLLTGPVIDQAALYGLLRKVRDLGMPLVSVSPIEPGLKRGARRKMNSNAGAPPGARFAAAQAANVKEKRR